MEARIKNSPEVHSRIEIKHPDDCLKTRLINFSDIHISTFSHDLPFPDHSNKFITQLKKINQTVKNSDSKNQCLAFVKKQDSYCYSIREADSKNLCLAQVKNQKSYCYSIKSSDSKNQCLALVK